ncbi:MAG: MoaD/ThiS family protein [Flavobacteriales bacterium]|nr:MoaD/ThiS family protein [Flavobacteriales bacterium]
MKVNVKYLGNIAEHLEMEYEYIELPVGSTYSKFIEILNAMYPTLQGFVYKVAINLKVVDIDIELKDDDEIAILPPYSGG